MTDVAPLINREAAAPIAWLSAKSNVKRDCNDQHSVSAQQFLHHVKQLASRLPDASYAINLCDNRYLFMVSLCAVILRQQTNLLPSNKNIATQERLQQRYQDSYIVHDAVVEISKKSKQCDLSNVTWQLVDPDDDFQIPRIPLAHLAAICFTSGSTGDAKPILKSWQTMVASSAINRCYMLPDAQRVFYHLATVPGQHMWGLETSVLLPMFANACLVDERPLYPKDIVSLLAQLPEPRCLVTTPLHLRALGGITADLPVLANVLSATAPLTRELAEQIEAQFATQVREVYGCSEVGSMALRKPTESNSWEIFSGLHFSQDDQGCSIVTADYLDIPVVLDDRLEMHEASRFSLHGRISDQVNIAGKRGSLLEVNSVLQSYPHIDDGVVFFPPQHRNVPRLVALVVLSEGGDKKALRAHFKKYLDAAFVPRPIIEVATLPREENGKILKYQLIELYQQRLE